MPGPIGNGIISPRDPSGYEEISKLLTYVTKESEFCSTLLDEDELNNLARGDRLFKWEAYQLAYFDLVGQFITNKPRQSGLSFACSAKYFATSQMSGRNFTAVFVSYKKEEAINKINYVKQIMQALPPVFAKRIIRDPLQMIEWENPANRTRSKIFSHAQKPIRGMTADKILFDEFAFFTMPGLIYESAFPAMIQTGGTMDIISTPFGLGGMFYDILTDVKRYSDFTRWHIKWWHCLGYVKDPSPEGHAKIIKYIEDHPEMSTEERVYTFGSDRLIVQYRNAMNVESFMQEFEGSFLDGEAAFFPKELIFEGMFNPETDLGRDYQPQDNDFFDKEGNPISPEEALADLNHGVAAKMEELGIKRKHYSTITELFAAVNTGEISRNLYAGFDVGVSKDHSCLVILEEIVFEDGSTMQVERYREFMSKWSLTKQQDYLFSIMSSGVIRRMFLDKGGIGWQMGDFLAEHFHKSQFEAVQLGGSPKTKERYMTNLKSRLNNHEIALLYSRDTIDHIYAIKREVRSTGGVVYTADEDRRHHADLAIAVALASLAGTQAGERPVAIFSKPRKGTSKVTSQSTLAETYDSLALEQEKARFDANRSVLRNMVRGDGHKLTRGSLRGMLSPMGAPLKPY